MFLKSKWFRFILTAAVSLALIIIGILFMDANGSLFMAVKPYGFKGWAGEAPMIGSIFILFAVEYFFLFLSQDFFYYSSDKETGILFSIANAAISIAIFIMTLIIAVDVGTVQDFLAGKGLTLSKFDWGMGEAMNFSNAFLPALVLMPFAFSHLLMGVSKAIGRKVGEGIFLALTQPVALVIAYFAGYALIAAFPTAVVWILVGTFVAFVIYWIFIEIRGIVSGDDAPRRSRGSRSSGRAPRVWADYEVASALRQALDRRMVSTDSVSVTYSGGGARTTLSLTITVECDPSNLSHYHSCVPGWVRDFLSKVKAVDGYTNLQTSVNYLRK